jgi:hypothetical protein
VVEGVVAEDDEARVVCSMTKRKRPILKSLTIKRRNNVAAKTRNQVKKRFAAFNSTHSSPKSG